MIIHGWVHKITEIPLLIHYNYTQNQISEYQMPKPMQSLDMCYCGCVTSSKQLFEKSRWDDSPNYQYPKS